MMGALIEKHEKAATPLSFRSPAVGLLVFALFALCTLIFPFRSHAAPHLREVWRKPLTSVQSFGISPNGESLIVGYGDGRSHCYLMSGHRRWGTTFSTPHRISLSNDGRYALAFISQQPFKTMATLLHDGKTCRRVKLDGPIVGAGLSPDGRLGAAVTRKGWLYLFRRRGSCFSSSRYRVRSSPRTLLVPRAGMALVGYSGPGGVEAYGADGRLRWRLPGEVQRVYDLSSGPDGHVIGILSYRRGYGDRIRAYVLASSGNQIWQAPVPGIFPRLALEAEGGRAAVGYTEVLRAGQKTGYARKIAHFDSRGRLVWEKGGLFFSPQLLGTVSPGPTVIARGEAADLYLLDERGGIQSHYRHPAFIRRTETAWNGRALLVWDVRNSLSYLRWER